MQDRWNPTSAQWVGPEFWHPPSAFDDRLALILPDEGPDAAMTFGDLSRRADGWRDRILGFSPDARALVALEFETTPEAIAAYLGALRSGCPLLVLEPGQIARADRLVTAWRPEIAIAREDDRFDARPTGTRQDAPAPHPDLRLLLSTSGSTGDPKLVRLSGGNIASNAQAIARYLDIRPSNRAATTLPLFYSYGLSVLNSHLAAGAALVLIPDSVATPEFWAKARAASVTSLAFVPHQLELLDAGGFARMGLPSLRTVTQAGGRLDPALARRVHAAGQAAGWDLVIMYGQTEAAPRIAYVPPHLLPDACDTIGRAIPGGRLRIVTEDGYEIATPGQPGELVYDGPNVMMGYAERREDLARGPEVVSLRTGDLAEWTPEGLVRLKGRLKRFVKLYGLRLGLDGIETLLAREGIAAHAVAVGDELVLLHADPAQGGAAQAAVALEYGLPLSHIHAAHLPQVPLLSSGKTDHRALAAIAARALAQAGTAQAPFDLADLLRRATGAPEVRPDDSFASLGGDSLSYLDVQLALEERLGHAPDGWERMTLSELQRRIEDRAPPAAPGLPVDVPLRLAAVSLVVGQHATDYPLYGGTWALILLVGASFGRFQAQPLAEGRGLRVARRMLVPIVPLYLILLLTYEILRGGVPSSYLLLLGNYRIWTDGSALEPYWFVSLYAQFVLVIAGTCLLPGVRRALARRPWRTPALAFAASLAALLVVAAVPGVMGGVPVPYHPSRGLIECLPAVLLGWVIQTAATPRQRAWSAAGAVALWLVLAVVVLPGTGPAIALAAALALLLWRPTLRVPPAVGRALQRLAASTLWVYLLHVPLLAATWSVPVAAPVRLVLALGLSFMLARLAKAAYDRLSQRPLPALWGGPPVRGAA